MDKYPESQDHSLRIMQISSYKLPICGIPFMKVFLPRVVKNSLLLLLTLYSNGNVAELEWKYLPTTDHIPNVEPGLVI